MRFHFPSISFNATPLYEEIRYPGGELQIRILPEFIPALHKADVIEIDARIRDSADLIGLILLSNAIRGAKPGAVMRLDIPYLPYARADRRFVDGDCFGLQVFGDLLRTARFNEIHCLDIHNQRQAYGWVSSFLADHSPRPLIMKAYLDFSEKVGRMPTILLPDAGARTRFGEWGGVVLNAEKVRDAATGRLSGFSVPSMKGIESVMIVDDICDGGGTFAGIADEIRRSGFHPKLALYVTHGIFSKGIHALTKDFNYIYTTNSWSSRPGYDFIPEGTPLKELAVYDAWEAMQ